MLSMPSNIYSRYITLNCGNLSAENILRYYGIANELIEQGGMQFQEVRDLFKVYIDNLETSKTFLEDYPLLKDFCEFIKARLTEYEVSQ